MDSRGTGEAEVSAARDRIAKQEVQMTQTETFNVKRYQCVSFLQINID